jgi:SAM-dependent methyltransferase
MSYRELLIGCGNARIKKIRHGDLTEGWKALTTLDVDPSTKPDVVHDLNATPYPFPDDSFDEIHAYDVLEHLGSQGDWRAWFAQMSELWRILKPDGLLIGTVPAFDSPWAWGDPGHTRVITQGTLLMLSQALYDMEVGKTNITDYRPFYKADFKPVGFNESEHSLGFVMQAVKNAGA